MTIRILVVDDSATVRYQLVQQLRASGMEVVEARDGREALAALQGGDAIDVVVSDLRMPGMNGLTLVNTIQGDSRLAGIPVCILTSSSDESDHVQNLEAGASAFIRKPWKAEVLVATVRRLARLRETTVGLEQASRTDALTGLANRRHGDECLREEISRSRRYARGMAVALLDIDRFKRVNDTLGHAAGDEVLRHVAAELRRRTRRSDVVVRWGGEEFLFILPETGLDEAAGIVDRFRAHLASHPMTLAAAGGETLTVTISGGVAELEDGDTPESIVERADTALYRAKETGRNRLLMWRLGELLEVRVA